MLESARPTAGATIERLSMATRRRHENVVGSVLPTRPRASGRCCWICAGVPHDRERFQSGSIAPIDGAIECGPNAVFSFKREGYSKTSFNLRDTFESFTWPGFQRVAGKYWRTGLGEFYRSFSKKAFVEALNKLIPEIREEDLIKGGAGVRAQASDKSGGLVDDFYIVESERVIHVCNAPSPAATSSLAIGEHITNKLFEQIR